MRLVILFLMCVTASAQMPPPVKHPQIVNYSQAQNQTNGMATDWSVGEIVHPIGLAGTFTCSNNLLPGWWTVLGTGRTSHTHTTTNYWGTNSTFAWPVPLPPVVKTFYCGGVPFLSITNTATNNLPVRFFTSKATGRSNVWDILDATNCPYFRDAFTFVTAPNGKMTSQ
jgi:hypothetical protein